MSEITGKEPKGNESVHKARGREAWPKNRPERMSLGERGSLTYDPQLLRELKAQGLTPRLVSDDPGRVDTFLRRGWKFIQDDGNIGDEMAAQPGKIGGNAVKHVGGGKSGYLMAVPTEWYEEDQRKKQDAIDASEEGMKAPKKGEKLKDGDVGIAYGPGLTND
jgi:hypothetical protein